MMKKTLITVLVVLVLFAAVPASSMAASGKITPYKGAIGADSPLYGLKLFVQHVDESLAGSNDAKLQKQMNHAQERLAEMAAAAETNNSGAMEAALSEYNAEIDGINSTMEQDGVTEEQYSEIGPEIDDQQQAIVGMIENGSIPENLQDDLISAYNNSTKIKNGRPFVLYNNTTYFVPPGHLTNGQFNTYVPPGLAKKGYVAPQPVIENGAASWPYPFNLTQKGNGKNKFTNSVNLTDADNTTVSKSNGKNKTNGNGNGNGNGKK